MGVFWVFFLLNNLLWLFHPLLLTVRSFEMFCFLTLLNFPEQALSFSRFTCCRLCPSDFLKIFFNACFNSNTALCIIGRWNATNWSPALYLMHFRPRRRMWARLGGSLITRDADSEDCLPAVSLFMLPPLFTFLSVNIVLIIPCWKQAERRISLSLSACFPSFSFLFLFCVIRSLIHMSFKMRSQVREALPGGVLSFCGSLLSATEETSPHC